MDTTEKVTAPGQAYPGFFEVAGVEPVEMMPGVTIKLVSGVNAMMSFVTLQPGTMVPIHSHDHEQLGIGLEGEMVLYIGGLEDKYAKVIKAGDCYVIPSGVPHGAKPAGDAAATALDIFSPPRADYLEKFRALYNKEVPGLEPR